ncbi:MAG: oligosaccharide flippase family protein [Altibacter sp.]|nr:oligosaccharide flippase family protein [Altibacter sp.]
MVLPLITLPYVIRVLGFSNYGMVVLAAALVAYFMPIADYSFKITATRDVSVSRNSVKKLSLIYSKVMSLKLLFVIISTLLISLIVVLYPPFYDEKVVFFLSILLLFGHSLFPEWFFQGIEKMKYIAFLNFGIKLFFTISVFVFITKAEDYWVYPLLQGIGFIVAGLAGQYMLIKKYKLKFYFLKRKYLLDAIKDNFPIFVNQFFPTLYNNTNTFLLGIFTTVSLVGIYDAIKKVVDVCVMLVSIISRVFFPFLNRKRDSFGKFNTMMLSIGLILSVLPLFFSKVIFWYLNVDHEYAFTVLCLLSLSIFGYTLYTIYGLNYFIVQRKDKLVMNNTIISSLLAFGLAFPLIFYFDIIGAAINLLIARFLMGGYLWYKWQFHEKH